MHPAPSVIVFTVLSGLGFGTMTLLGLGFGPSGAVAGPFTGLFALALAGAGLLASTLHLGNAQRAWRAFSQWRTSWLSREGVVSVALMAVFFAYVAGWFLTGAPSRPLGLLSALLAALAVFSTAMIYAQLKTVPRWSNPFTVAMFLGLALAGGVIANGLAMAMAGETAGPGAGLPLLIGSAAAYAYRRRTGALTLGTAATPESATGLGALGKVRQVEPPHSAPNYLMKEMIFVVGRRRAEKLAVLFVIFGLFAPLFLYILSRDAGALAAPGLALALLLHLFGAFVSRWLFFAEAEHVVGLYYGRR
ncbi:MAG: dimethyl sulfoxide reductase anchor subunit family protein [Pikeienuella sp.]|uniref:dimethyl sulfoxide reductase anchor subunit family protein n=1 Tax=Pikeienuella sp. TaxID=2831957 RepID=UPI00391AAF90